MQIPRKQSGKPTVIVDLNRDVLRWSRIIANKHERALFQLRGKAYQNVLLICGDVTGGRVELVAYHVAR